jgi:membrane-associated phospholipid phosphatase
MGSSVAAGLLALALCGGAPVPAPPPDQADRATAVATPGATAEPQPRKPSVLRLIAGDFGRTFTSKESLWILGVGGAAALLVSPLDDEVSQSRFNSELYPDTTLDALFEPGDIGGDAWVQVGGPLAIFAVGKLAGNAHLAGLGGDLLRAQIVTGGITGALKLATQRTRPDASNELSFPSGHASAAFATATVVERRYGLKVGVPAYAVATWIAASRLNENKHFLSDVTFGAAIGIAAGRAVTAGRGSVKATVAPQIVPGGGGGFQVIVKWQSEGTQP